MNNPAGPLPKFDGITTAANVPPPQAPPATLQPQASGPIRVPPLSPEKVSEYTSIFENAGSRDGILPGNIFPGLKGRIANVHDC